MKPNLGLMGTYFVYMRYFLTLNISKSIQSEVIRGISIFSDFDHLYLKKGWV